jgi:glycogen debranching enzyme
MSQATTKSKEIKKNDSLSEKEKEERKQQVLTQGRASITRSIADAVVIKSANIFFLSRPDGNVPLGDSHGYGLYYHDCRYLKGYELTLGNARLNSLVSATPTGDMAIFELTNPELKVNEGEHITSDEIGLTWKRRLDSRMNRLEESIQIKNYGNETVELPLSLQFQAGFEDVFAIRGLLSEKPGIVHPPEWRNDELVFIYDGADERYRGLSIHFSTPPSKKDLTSVQFDLTLKPRETRKISISLAVSETTDREKLLKEQKAWGEEARRSDTRVNKLPEWLDEHVEYESDSLLLNKILTSSLRDLRTLVTSIDEYEFFAAGVPWFVTLFGRDSLITGLQTLAVQPAIAAETLRLLAKFQAKEMDHYRDAQPGKILHELRIGELARLGEIPHTPYYGTVDATPLFLILLASHADWTGDLRLFEELKESAEAALDWIDKYGDANGDGYVEYESKSEKGLVNQGWKDSGNGIVNADGSLADPPISLVEVQGYVYQAKSGIAGLFDRAGETARAQQLRQEAEKLRSSFNRDFWLEDMGIYTLALEAGGDPLRVVSSNPGHALWSGIADQDKARRTAEKLMAEDMFSGWGIRTLSTKEKCYNPTGYHLGTVWPHENALIAAGFLRYGLHDLARRVCMGILESAMSFKGYQLPELFAGFSRAEYSVPVHSPVACHPQAWAAGSIPFLLGSFLGFEPMAFENKLLIHQPILPSFVDRIRVKQLQVGNARVDLHYERQSDDSTKVEVLKVDGNLDVITE